jgi:hypothetical protein
MSRELLQQALNALLISAPLGHAVEDYEYRHRLIKDIEAELAKPEQAEPLSPVDIGVDVTPEGTHVVACYNRHDAVQEMFYSQFHPLAKPEQEPKLTDAGADTNISRGLEPKGSGMVTLNQVGMRVYLKDAPPRKPEQEPVVEVQSFGEKQVFVVLKPLSDGDKLYTAPPRKEWVGLTDEEIKEVLGLNETSWSLSGVALQHVMDDARALEAKLKEKNGG